MVIARQSRRRFFRGVLVVAIVLGICGAPAVSAGAASAPDPGINAYVVGGTPVGVGEFPSLAAIMLDDQSVPAPLRLLCSGTVVTRRWILSAGHCSLDVLFGERLVVQVGSRDLGAASAQTVPINRATVHRTYFSRGVAYDVALFHTKAPVNVPVSRLATAADVALEAGGSSATAVGWGLTKQLGIEQFPGFRSRPPRRARAVEVPIVDDPTCSSTYADFSPGYFVPASDLCAGTEGKDVCYGDSGGPLFAKDPQGELVQIGVVSRGAGCATKLFPSIYTDVARVQAWIHRYTTHVCPNKVEIPPDPAFPDEPPPGPLYVC